MCDKLRIKIPVRIFSEANLMEHWSVKHRRKKQQKLIIHTYLKKYIKNRSLPVKIEICRIAPRQLDFDNLLGGLKTTIDTIADFFIPGLQPGRADGSDQLEFTYSQKKGNPKEYAIELQISSAGWEMQT